MNPIFAAIAAHCFLLTFFACEPKKVTLEKEATLALSRSVIVLDEQTGTCYRYYNISPNNVGITDVSCKAELNNEPGCYSKCYEVCEELTSTNTEGDP